VPLSHHVRRVALLVEVVGQGLELGWQVHVGSREQIRVLHPRVGRKPSRHDGSARWRADRVPICVQKVSNSRAQHRYRIHIGSGVCERRVFFFFFFFCSRTWNGVLQSGVPERCKKSGGRMNMKRAKAHNAMREAPKQAQGHARPFVQRPRLCVRTCGNRCAGRGESERGWFLTHSSDQSEDLPSPTSR
jgi:hypothetical protein